MDFLSHFISAINSLVNNPGLSIVISVIICYTVTIPFKIMSIKNQKAQKACQPELEAIRKKYNANAMGISMDNDESLAPEIRAMNKDERSEAMANETSALYKKNGYHMWTGWIPAVLTLTFIILLYNGIRTFTPDGLYSLTFKTRNTIDLANASQFVWTVLGAVIGTSLLTPIWNTITSVVKAKRQQQSIKNALIAALISSVLGIGISVWIASSVTMSTAIAISTFYILSFFETIITTCHKGTDAPTQ